MGHAWNSDMMEWVMNDADKANAFILSRAGYDVWMGNNRGTKYSMEHVTKKPSDRDFWDFYQAEMGIYDLPAFIEHISTTTGVSNMSYIGHSQGTTQFLLGGAISPDYFSYRINLAILMAPVARPASVGFPLSLVASNFTMEKFALVDVMHMYNWFGPDPISAKATDAFCSLPYLSGVCKAMYEMFADPELMNINRLTMARSNAPSGSTWKNTAYYAQVINSGKYNLYDYGKKWNLKIYGQEDVAPVPIENYKVRTALMSGDSDAIAVPADVEFIKEALGDNLVFAKEYHANHGTFVLGNDMSFFSEDAVGLLKKYNPTNRAASDDTFLQ